MDRVSLIKDPPISPYSFIGVLCSHRDRDILVFVYLLQFFHKRDVIFALILIYDRNRKKKLMTAVELHGIIGIIFS